MSKQISSADLLWVTAECVVKVASKLGIKVNVVDVYNEGTIKSLALAGACLRTVIESTVGEKIEVTKS